MSSISRSIFTLDQPRKLIGAYLQANKLVIHHSSTAAFGKLGFFTFLEGVYIPNVDLPVKSIRIEKQKLMFRSDNWTSVVSIFFQGSTQDTIEGSGSLSSSPGLPMTPSSKKLYLGPWTFLYLIEAMKARCEYLVIAVRGAALHKHFGT